MKAKRITALLCAALLILTAGCGEEDRTPALSDGPVFTVAVAQAPDSLNPYVSAGGLSEELFLLCYDPLWRIGASGEPEPCLAEDWSLSSDRLTWTVRLRKGVLFSDGTEVTAADVEYSYELLRHSPLYAEYFDGITAIRCPDEYTVILSTEREKSDMMENPAPILPRHIWKDQDEASYANADMVGSGPFVFCPGESGEQGWTLRSRKEHFGQEALAGGVFFASYGTVTGAARALAAGEADASFGLTDVQLTTLESVPGVELVQAMLPTAECRGLAFNTRSRAGGNAAVRQAIDLCLDRDWFLLMSSGGAGAVGSSFMSPGSDCFSAPAMARGYDLNAARSLLASAGYTDQKGKGTLQYRDGTDLKLVLYTSSLDEWAATAATILTADLTELGVDVTWRKTDQPIRSVCTAKGDWDLCFVSWRGERDAPLTAARYYRDISGLTGWTSPEFMSVLDQLRSAWETTAARSLAAQLQQRAYEDCPAAVLSYGADIQAVRNDAWTGYQEALAASGGLFGTGSAAVYMSVTPAEPAES